jgi:hypothetical protein
VITTTANFDGAAAASPLLPVFRFAIEGYSKVFVYRPTGRSGEVAWISNISSWTVSVDPTNGSYTIGDLVITALDYGAAITTDLGILLLEQRRCTLQVGYDGLVLTDYCTLFSGIVNTVTSNDDGTYDFTCNDYNRLNQRVIYTTGAGGSQTTQVVTYNATDPYTILSQTTTTDPATGAITNTASFSYTSSGPSGPVGTTSVLTGGIRTTVVITSRNVMIGGTLTTIYEATTTVTGPTYQTVTTITYGGFYLYGVVQTTVVVDNITGVTTSTVTATTTTTATVGTTVTATNFNNISGSNPRLLQGHPLDMLIEILETEVGFATSDINVAQIQAYRDTVFTGLEFKFVLSSAPDAKDFIESQLLKPLGGYAYVNNLGQFCVGFAQPLPGGLTSGGAITQFNVTTLPSLGAATLVNVLTMRFDKDDAGVGTSNTGFLSESNTFYTPSIADLADLTGQVAQEAATGSGEVQGQLILESNGMRSQFQGFLMARMIANGIFAMYGFYNPTLQTTTLWNPLFKIELGEFVTFSHPLVPDRSTGLVGMVNKLFRISSRTYDFMNYTVTIILEDASGIKGFGAHKISPTGHTNFTGSSADDQTKYLFMSNVSGKQSTGVAGGNLG